MLSNIQFVEHRVAEEDVQTTENEKSVISEELTPEQFQEEIGIALSAGANFIVNAFEKIEIEQSDDDEDDEEIQPLEPIYESKNIYHARKLPHIIGTQAFLVRSTLHVSYK